MAQIEYEILRTPSKDHDQIVSLILASIKSSPWKDAGVNLPHIKMQVDFFLTHIDLDKRLVAVARDGSKIIGVIAGAVVQAPLVGTSMASELIWYVEPAYRKKNIAAELLTLYEKWADDSGAQYITLSHYNNKLGETVGVLYEKRGFKKMEVSYIKELK